MAQTSDAQQADTGNSRLGIFSSDSRNEERILLVLTLIIGAVVGLVVVAFILLTERLGSRLYPAGGAAWRRLLIPVTGSVFTGFLLARYFPNARGSGIPQTKAALYLRDGFIAFRTVLGKFGLSSISLASGIALGREGPSVHVGAGIASVLGRRLGLSPSSVKALVPVGASAALAAAFNTPIAAVLFSMEEVMGDMNAPVLGSIVLSSATSWIVLHLLLGDEPLFHVPAYQLVHPLEFLWYGVLGVAGGLVSVGFVKLLLRLRKLFLALPKSSLWIQPAAGGLFVGALGWFVPQVLGVGYNYVGLALNGQMLVTTMALLVFLKVLATACCYSSGNAGGIFGPSLYMGAMLGGAVGGLAHGWMPDYTGSVGAYALVGMGTAFAGIVRVPLTSVIMIFEMTRDYSIIVPLMISNLISYFISSKLQKEPIYEALQQQEGIHLPTGARARRSFLMAGNAFRAATLTLSSAERISQAAASVDRRDSGWPVVDQGGLRGMVTAGQLDEALRVGRGDEPLAELVPEPPPADQITAENFPHVHADHALDEALRRIAQSDLPVLPVVSRANVRELKGTISLPDILAAYKIGEAAEAPPAIAGRRRMTPLAGALAGLVLLVILAGFLNYYYRAGRAARAQQYFAAGNTLVQQGRYEEAAEQFRNALSITHNVEHRRALGVTLVRAGHPEEGLLYLNEVVRQRADDGLAHFAMAEAAAKLGQIDTAITEYRRAIDGMWPQDAQENRLEARLELIDLLAAAGRKTRAQAELLSLAADIPPQPGWQKRTARKLADFGMSSQAAALYREVLRRNPVDADALDGWGDFEFARGDFVTAKQAFANALQVDPTDATAKMRLQLCEDLLALDPVLPGLKAAQRYERSRRLLERLTQELQNCNLDPGLLQQARAAQGRRRPPSLSDAAESNLTLAQRIWGARGNQCAASPASDAAIGHLMAALPGSPAR